MGVAYDGLGSSAVIESNQGIWTAGKRCPDILISRVGGQDAEKRLYSQVPYGKFLILHLGAARAPQARFEDEAVHFTLLPQGTQHEGSDDQKETWFSDEQIFPSEVVSGESNLVVVVRPDLYIGYVGDGDWLKTSKGSLVDCFLGQSDVSAPPPPSSPTTPPSPAEKPATEAAVAKPALGSKPWLQILGAFFLYFNTWGK